MTVPKINSSHGSDTRNILNRAIDLINVQGKSIQDLVAKGQLTPTQYATLLQTVNGLIAKGDVAFEDIDINKGKLLPKHLSEEVLRMMTGDAPVNAVPADRSITREKLADKSVSAEKLDVMKESKKNLFNGAYDSAILSTYGGNGYFTRDNHSGYIGSLAVIPIVPNVTYTIKVHDTDLKNQFRVATNKNYPEYPSAMNEAMVDTFLVDNANLNELTFKNNATDNYLLVYVSNNGQKPRLQVEMGSAATPYEEGLYLDEKYIKEKELDVSLNDLNFIKRNDANLFEGYSDGLLFSTKPTDQEYYLIPVLNYGGYTGKTAIVPIKPNTKYFIKVFNETELMPYRIGASYSKIDFQEKDSDLIVHQPIPSRYSTLDHLIVSANEGVYPGTTEFENTDYNFLYVYVSNAGKEPELSITEDIEPETYPSPLVIPGNLLDTTNIDKKINEMAKKSDSNKSKYNFFVNLDTLYKHDEITDFIPNPISYTVAEYNTMFNNLISEHSENSKSTLLGTGEFGYEVYKYENTPEPYKQTATEGYAPDKIKIDYPLPKIVITANIHGRERTASYASYYFFKELMENPKNDPVLDFLKRNVHLIFVPVICGSGFEDNTYENRNGQNLNRDFAPHGNFTQAETKLVKKVIDENSDMDFHLDFHTTPKLEDPVGYTLTDDLDLALIGNNMYRELGRKWQLEHPKMPQNINHEWGYSTPSNIGTAGRYSQEEHGIKSTIFEVVQKLKWVSSENHDKFVTQMGVEMLANMIIGVLRSKQ